MIIHKNITLSPDWVNAGLRFQLTLASNRFILKGKQVKQKKPYCHQAPAHLKQKPSSTRKWQPKIPLVTAMLLAACQSDTGGGSSGSWDKKDRNYYLNHAYVRESAAHGNRAMAYAMSGAGKSAHQEFINSTEVMAQGVTLQRRYAAERAESQRTAATVFTTALMIAGTVAAADATGEAQTQQQLNAINTAHSDFLQASGNLGNFLHEQIRQSEAGSSAVSNVDRDRWRSVVVSDHSAAQSIVRIQNQSKGTFCTGFFVAPHVIMTAAHCFSIGDALGAHRQQPTNGKAFMTGEDEYIEIERQYQPSDYDRKNIALDFALLTTAKPSRHYLPVSTSPVQPGRKLMAIGYSGDLNGGFFLRIDYGCRVTSIAGNGIIKTNCATWGGNSGGPLLTADGKISVIGVHSSSWRQLDRSSDNGSAPPVRHAAAIYDAVIADPLTKGRVSGNPFR